MSGAAPQAPLAMDGEWTIYRAAELHAVLRDAVTPAGDLVLDLGGATECDTAGVQLLLATARVLEARGDRLRLAACAEPVRDALQSLGLAQRLGAQGEAA